MEKTMYEPRDGMAVERPTTCPFCNGRIVGTLAKVINRLTLWRCRSCDRTWTIASLQPRRAEHR